MLNWAKWNQTESKHNPGWVSRFSSLSVKSFSIFVRRRICNRIILIRTSWRLIPTWIFCSHLYKHQPLQKTEIRANSEQIQKTTSKRIERTRWAKRKCIYFINLISALRRAVKYLHVPISSLELIKVTRGE